MNIMLFSLLLYSGTFGPEDGWTVQRGPLAAVGPRHTARARCWAGRSCAARGRRHGSAGSAPTRWSASPCSAAYGYSAVPGAVRVRRRCTSTPRRWCSSSSSWGATWKRAPACRPRAVSRPCSPPSARKRRVFVDGIDHDAAGAVGAGRNAWSASSRASAYRWTVSSSRAARTATRPCSPASRERAGEGPRCDGARGQSERPRAPARARHGCGQRHALGADRPPGARGTGAQVLLGDSVDRLAAVFLPLVLLLAAGSVVFWSGRTSFEEALLTGSPCWSLPVLARSGWRPPLATTLGIAAAAQRGILIRSGAALERLARIKAIAFDKTGTLTQGQPQVVSVLVDGATEHEVLQRATALALTSEHPLAAAIAELGRDRGVTAAAPATHAQAHPGAGLSGEVEGGRAALGSSAFMASLGWQMPPRMERGNRCAAVHAGLRGLGRQGACDASRSPTGYSPRRRGPWARCASAAWRCSC